MNLKEKFKAFEKAYLELAEALEMDNYETEINNESYPFEKSFDEYLISIMEWCGDNADERN